MIIQALQKAADFERSTRQVGRSNETHVRSNVIPTSSEVLERNTNTLQDTVTKQAKEDAKRAYIAELLENNSFGEASNANIFETITYKQASEVTGIKPNVLHTYKTAGKINTIDGKPTVKSIDEMIDKIAANALERLTKALESKNKLRNL